MPGIYRLRLTVTEAGDRRGSDVLTVTDAADAPPLGVPIETMVRGGEAGEEYWIEVGGERYPLRYEQADPDVVQAVFLDRGTLELLGSESYGASAAEAQRLGSQIERYGAKALTIVSNPGPGGSGAEPASRQVSPAYGPVLGSLGVKSVPRLTAAGWSVVGVYGSGDGGSEAAGTNPGSQPGNLRGYLARDSSNLYGFVPATVAAFDTSVAGAPALQNRIDVAGQTYASQPLACPEAAGGFQLLVLYAETLQPRSAATFTTNGCGPAAAAGETLKLVEALQSLPGSGAGAQLVVLQSIGSPREANPAEIPAWTALAATVGELGGTAAVLDEARGGYALLAGVGIAEFPLTEASESLTGTAARFTGVLQQNALGAFVPMAASPAGEVPFDLAEIAHQPPQAWPASQTEGEKNALAYAAEVLDLPKPTAESSCYVPPQPDVRSEYCNEKLRGEWAAFVSQLRGAECGGGCQAEHGFSGEDWEAVKAELAGRGGAGEFAEFNAVQSTWELIRTLQAPFGAAGVNAVVDLNSLATQIEQALRPPPASRAEGNFLNIFSNILFEASYIPFTDAFSGPMLGALAAGLGIEAMYARGPEGSPLLGEFQVDAADLAVDLAKNLQAGSGELGTVGELVVSDYGKLRAVSEDPNLAGFSPRVAEGITGTVEIGSRQWIYQTVFPAAYEALNLRPGNVNGTVPATAHDYQCQWTEIAGSTPIEGYYRPFSPEPPAEYRYASPGPTLGVLAKRGAPVPHDGGKEIKAESPPASLFAPLYKPVGEGGLGMYVPWFWHQAFGFPDVKSVSC